MKKLIVVTLMLSIAGIAFASSLAIPWFSDNAAAACGLPPTTKGVVSTIFLKNNMDAVKVCAITYFTQDGTNIGPLPPGNTFGIQPKASLAFRPCTYDPVSLGGGEDDTAGALAPDRPPHGNSSLLAAVPGNDDKKNGSAVIQWEGGTSDVQGSFVWVQSARTALLQVSYAHLLPPGL